MIELICQACGATFVRPISLHKSNIKRGRKIIACSNACVQKARFKDVLPKTSTCTYCGLDFIVKHGASGKYCSRACSGKHIAELRRKPKPIKKEKPNPTLGELRSSYSISQYHAKIRSHARSIYKQNKLPLVCKNCGYNLHVDICHITDVKDFPVTATINEVNSIDNLVALDKRCHWEFDNGYLSVVTFGVEPKSSGL